MKKSAGKSFKLIIGLLVSVLFLYLAFREIDFSKMKDAFFKADYRYFIPIVFSIFISHWLRSFRWQYLLKSLKKIPVTRLFTATLIGYMGNTILPAHLGEIFRANVIGNSENISSSSTFATIVIDRIIDVLSILVILVFALMVYPFPDSVKTSGYIGFVLVIALFVFLVFLKRQNKRTMAILRFCLRVIPEKAAGRIEDLIIAFIDGLNGLEKRRDYIIITVLSFCIWFCYWLNFYFLCYAFNLFEFYHLKAVTSLVLLVITTASIVVPSSPGYVGTFHYLCKISLGWFGVPGAIALSYAIVIHALSNYPVALAGLICAWREGMNRIKTEKE